MTATITNTSKSSAVTISNNSKASASLVNVVKSLSFFRIFRETGDVLLLETGDQMLTEFSPPYLEVDNVTKN